MRLASDGVLHYSRDSCIPADTEHLFFLHITPADAADLLPESAEYGFNNADFFFSGKGGTIDADGRCVVEYELPDYEIESILTGQILPGEDYPDLHRPYRTSTGQFLPRETYQLWEARFHLPTLRETEGAQSR